MSAVMASEMQNTDNIVFLILDDCRSITTGEFTAFSEYVVCISSMPVTHETIIYGLGAIEGVGEGRNVVRD